MSKKYLIVGLGNTGPEYVNTRHNIGFKLVNHFAKTRGIVFETRKLGTLANYNFKGRKFLLLKPNTFMNLSGKAVKYWMEKEKIPKEKEKTVKEKGKEKEKEKIAKERKRKRKRQRKR